MELLKTGGSDRGWLTLYDCAQSAIDLMTLDWNQYPKTLPSTGVHGNGLVEHWKTLTDSVEHYALLSYGKQLADACTKPTAPDAAGLLTWVPRAY